MRTANKNTELTTMRDVCSFMQLHTENVEGASSSMTFFKMLKRIVTILERITSFDNGNASSFFFCYSPQTSSTMSRAHGFTEVLQ
jgi:hypothetical protein